MSMLSRKNILGVLLLSISSLLTAQDAATIVLNNPSFEDLPRHSHSPRSWTDCGFPGESPPDVQPDPQQQFLVTKLPTHGSTYLGLVVRDNDTWEKVGQRLSQAMQSGACYEFKIFLARSETYVSQSRILPQQANYATPAKLRIYGGFDLCDRAEMLAESRVVTNTRWLEYRFKLSPGKAYTHLVLEAFYNTPTLFPYNGNILLDNASSLVPIPCDQPLSDEPVVASAPSPLRPPTNQPKPSVKTDQPPVRKPLPEPTTSAPAKRIGQVERKDLSVGQIFQIEDINFKANSAEIEPSSETILQEILGFMRSNQDVVVEIGGHTSGLASTAYANELSASRAKAVVDYLVKRGVERRRLQAKGYGKSKQIASSGSLAGRRKNQRVEIKVLGFLQG